MWLLPLPDQLEVLIFGALATLIIGSVSGRVWSRYTSSVISTAAFIASFYITLVQFLNGYSASFGPKAGIPGSVVVIDQLSNFISLVVLAIFVFSSIYSAGYIGERHTEYFSLLLVLAIGMLGVFYAGDAISFFVYWEVMSLGSYLLVAFNYREWEAVEASLKYLIMSSTGSAALLFGISLLYGLSGDLTFAGMRSVLASEAASRETWSVAAFAFVIGGLAVNAAVAPFHFWLPDAHPAAPSPVSALLSGVVIKTGVYGMLRLLLNVFPLEQYGWQLGLLMLGIVTMTVGNLMAALQDDIKRLLAFSSVANIGYIVFGISLGNQLGLVGSILHVLNHAVAKALLFLSAGSFIHTFHTRSLEELSGAGKYLPVTGITYTVGALSLAGVPGLNAFVSEYIIIAGALASPFWPFAVVMVLNVLIGAMYHLRVIQTIFLKPPQRANPEAAKEPGFSMLLPMVLLAVTAIVIGIYPSPFLAAAEAALRSIPLVR
jgi:proton-translocating NADH-quinone oxidoreductase chain M